MTPCGEQENGPAGQFDSCVPAEAIVRIDLVGHPVDLAVRIALVARDRVKEGLVMPGEAEFGAAA